METSPARGMIKGTHEVLILHPRVADPEPRRSLFRRRGEGWQSRGLGVRVFSEGRCPCACPRLRTGRQGRGERDSEIRLKQVSRSYILQGARS